ncbi:phosphate propanoyltransferase [Candidatus Woesearchaeota archaeon]|nr:phosphate propanoyltransferase [Candidatus Woesearchaeota archaeon]
MTDKQNIPIEVSNRHIHLSKKDIGVLFGKDYMLKVARKLSQPGQFAAHEKVHLVSGDKRIENVRVLGPEREETQVELLKTDATYLNIAVPLRLSGDIEGTPGITIKGPKGSIELEKGVIIAKRHIHVSEKQAEKLGIKDKEHVSIRVNGNVFDELLVRTGPGHNLAVHLDTDEGNATCINKKTFGELIKCQDHSD